MIDDKCPTCPNYGGPCDCGSSKYVSGGTVFYVLVVLFAFVFGWLVANGFKFFLV